MVDIQNYIHDLGEMSLQLHCTHDHYIPISKMPIL